MTMTFPTPTTRQDSATIVDFAQALQAAEGASTPAALTEALLPEIRESFWLLVSSTALSGARESLVLRMILERALPKGVSIALWVDWTPESWGLSPGDPPTAEVLRRFRRLSQAAQLICCDAEEAQAFLGSDDPAAIQETLPQRPAVLISEPGGVLRWSIGGRQGRMAPHMMGDSDIFLAALLERLVRHPQLLGTAGPGIDAVADPDGLAEQLLAAATASVEPAAAGSDGRE